jgi:hypothetical protein
MLASTRSRLFDLIDGQGLLPTRRYVPDDVSELPCIVIGPTSLNPGREAVVMEASVDVYVIGRRVGDDDSQSELDTYADHVLTILGGTRGRDQFAVQSSRPQLVTVAGVDYPAHVITATISVVTC